MVERGWGVVFGFFRWDISCFFILGELYRFYVFFILLV